MDYRSIPGPGDEETWGPCTGHPMDPRTVNPTETAEFEIRSDEMTRERIGDINGYLSESFSEADDSRLAELKEALLLPPSAKSSARIGDVVRQMVEDYCTPSDEEVIDSLNGDH